MHERHAPDLIWSDVCVDNNVITHYIVSRNLLSMEIQLKNA